MKIDQPRVSRSFMAALFVIAGLLVGAAQADIQSTGFKDIDVLLQQAAELNAGVLAPRNYQTAEKYFQSARKHSESGRPERARKELVKANAALRNAIEAAKIAQLVFTDALKARERAITAEAPNYEPALWSAGETTLMRGTRKLEKANRKGASADGSKAAKAFTVAEVAAIKTRIVGNARILIAAAEADSNNVERNAPITLARARSLVAQAEAAVDVSRYQIDSPVALAAEAEYQAKHAMYLAGQAALLKARQMTAEELILKWEKPLRDLAASLEVTTDMTSGYAAAGEAALVQANSLMAQAAAKNVRSNELAVVPDSTESAVQASEQANQQLAQVESLLAVQQARVLLEGGDIILRLDGLSFPSGQAVIETQHFGLLTAVKKSLAVFPDAYVTIEGHTDSQGEENQNLILSQQRANSVRSYLIANTGLSATKISAEGYGESRPLSTNMYADGRAQNRRIDVIINNVWADNQATARLTR